MKDRKRKSIKILKRAFIITAIACIFFSTAGFAEEKPVEKEEVKLTFEQEVLNLIEDALDTLPEKIKTLKPQVRTVAIYSVFVDKEKFSPILLKQLQTKIESAFTRGGTPLIIFVPELKPAKIIARENKFILASGIRSREELLEIAKKNYLDGIMEVDLLYSQGSLYLSLKITEVSTSAIVWSETFSAGIPQASKKKKFTNTDFGLGINFMQLLKVSSGATKLNVPDSASHYVLEFAFTESQPPQARKNIRYSFRVGGLFNNSVIKSDETTFISGYSFVISGFYLKGGIIYPIIENLNNLSRNYLDFTLSTGLISAFGTDDMIDLSIGLETAITNHFSFSGEFSFVSPVDAELSGSKIRVGGSSVQLLILKYRF